MAFLSDLRTIALYSECLSWEVRSARSRLSKINAAAWMQFWIMTKSLDGPPSQVSRVVQCEASFDLTNYNELLIGWYVWAQELVMIELNTLLISRLLKAWAFWRIEAWDYLADSSSCPWPSQLDQAMTMGFQNADMRGFWFWCSDSPACLSLSLSLSLSVHATRHNRACASNSTQKHRSRCMHD